MATYTVWTAGREFDGIEQKELDQITRAWSNGEQFSFGYKTRAYIVKPGSEALMWRLDG